MIALHPWLSETQKSFALMLLALGVVVLLPLVVDTRRTVHRVVLLLGVLALAL